MIASRVKHRALAAAGACLLAACGGAQSSFEPARAAQGLRAVNAYARDLLYINDYSGVEVYSYPRGKPLGLLGVGGALCSDKFGNIVVAGSAGTSQVWVYPHGGSEPIAHMYDPGNSGGCSVDPSSENIAVTDPFANSVVIWPYSLKRGWRLAHVYTDLSMFESSDCTYDPQGNLFLDGYTSNRSFMLAELPKGSSTFVTITLNRAVHSPGYMQWDGSDLVIADAGKSSSSAVMLDRFAIAGSSGHRVGTTTLTNSVAQGQFLILGRTVIGRAKESSLSGLGFWPYPKGGAPGRILSTYGPPFSEALSPK